jgi:hypothetical protein
MGNGTSGTYRDMTTFVPEAFQRDRQGHTLKGVPVSRCFAPVLVVRRSCEKKQRQFTTARTP